MYDIAACNWLRASDGGFVVLQFSVYGRTGEISIIGLTCSMIVDLMYSIGCILRNYSWCRDMCIVLNVLGLGTSNPD